MAHPKLNPHPRLYITTEHLWQLHLPTHDEALLDAEKFIREEALRLLGDLVIPTSENQHNWHLLRARDMQCNVFVLLTEFKRTGDMRFRDAILSCVQQMAKWEYWSWIAWRRGDSRPEAVYDLSYGENAATLAVAFDLLFDTLSSAEREMFVQTAQRRAFKPYLERNGGAKQDWYYKKPDTNWNTVCNGGAGMLALALYEFCPEAARVLEVVEQGIAPYFESMSKDGGWPEGIGYWNYGMRYGFMYLLSHERATGARHHLLERSPTQATLLFPLLFSPNGISCSFGDVNAFAPLPFHLAAAERYGRWDIAAELLRRGMPAKGCWPNGAELLLLHPRGRLPETAHAPATEWNRIGLMDGLEWGYAADRMPNPAIYISVRGGTTKVPHSHLDLLTFYCVVGGERLISSTDFNEDHDSTFGPRRFELYENAAESKNGIFINGVGITQDSTVATTLISGKGFYGFRIDATDAMGKSHDGPASTFCCRTILLIEGMGVLVCDRVELPFPGLIESRLHTYSQVELEHNEALIRGRREQLHLAFTAAPSDGIKRGEGLPTVPAHAPDTILRHYIKEKVTAATLCAFLSPSAKCGVKLSMIGDRTAVELTTGMTTASMELNAHMDNIEMRTQHSSPA